MSQADRIRQHAIDRYIEPARKKGLDVVTIRAGDIHRDLGLERAIPAVCSAMGSKKLLQLGGLSLKARTGPVNGANVYFTFRLDPPLSEAPAA